MPRPQQAGRLSEHAIKLVDAVEEQNVFIEEALIDVWRQVLQDRSKSVTFGDQIFIVKRTAGGLLQIDFVLDGIEIRGLEQNPNTKSKWAEMAGSGKKVMQFLRQGRYFANVASGKVTTYRDPNSTSNK
jgi:hypothetical protein